MQLSDKLIKFIRIASIPLGSPLILGRYGNKGIFLTSSGIPIKNGQQVNNLLATILLPSETVVFKTEVHTKKTEPKYKGNALADFPAKVAATEIYKGCGTCV